MFRKSDWYGTTSPSIPKLVLQGLLKNSSSSARRLWNHSGIESDRQFLPKKDLFAIGAIIRVLPETETSGYGGSSSVE